MSTGVRSFEPLWGRGAEGAWRVLTVLTVLSSVAVAFWATSAAALTISDGTGTISVNDSDGSLTQFVAGGPDDLFDMTHYFRTPAMSAESPMIGQLADPLVTSVSQIAPDTIRTVGSTSSFDYTLDYVLAGTQLTTTLTLSDTSGSDQSMALFLYQDWDLDDGANDQLVWDGTTMTIFEAVLDREVDVETLTAAIAAEASGFGPLLGSLTDGSPTSLTDGAGLPFGPADATFALEYDLFLGANGQTTVVTRYTLVPEPGTASLLGLGLAALAVARRRGAQAA